MELTQEQVDAGFVLISTTPEQADWNERWARAYRDLQDAAHGVNILALCAAPVDEMRKARFAMQNAQDRLDALDLEAENMVREQEERWAAFHQHEIDAVMSGQPVDHPSDWGL